jgi:hypothetical protein
VHQLVAALLDYTQILHHICFRNSRAAQRFAERVLIAADLGEYALDALLQVRNGACRLLSLEIVSASESK